MFQFPGLAFVPYVFRNKYLLLISASPKTLARRTGRRLIAVRDVLGVTEIEGGFPHSEIRGSKLVRSSPRHIAAYHVLHRLSAPRHSPNTLKALDRSHCRCPPLGSGAASLRMRLHRLEKTIVASNAPESAAVKPRSQAGDADRRTLTGATKVGCISSSRCRTTRRSAVRRGKLTFLDESRRPRRLVEPDGIEPTTSCLQSTRSPN